MWGDPASKGFLFFPHENKESDLWTVICVGTQLNHEFVAGGIENMAKEFSDATGRTDIEFVSSSWLVKYRCVHFPSSFFISDICASALRCAWSTRSAPVACSSLEMLPTSIAQQVVKV